MPGQLIRFLLVFRQRLLQLFTVLLLLRFVGVQNGELLLQLVGLFLTFRQRLLQLLAVQLPLRFACLLYTSDAADEVRRV